MKKFVFPLFLLVVAGLLSFYLLHESDENETPSPPVNTHAQNTSLHTKETAHGAPKPSKSDSLAFLRKHYAEVIAKQTLLLKHAVALLPFSWFKDGVPCDTLSFNISGENEVIRFPGGQLVSRVVWTGSYEAYSSMRIGKRYFSLDGLRLAASLENARYLTNNEVHYLLLPACYVPCNGSGCLARYWVSIRISPSDTVVQAATRTEDGLFWGAGVQLNRYYFWSPPYIHYGDQYPDRVADVTAMTGSPYHVFATEDIQYHYGLFDLAGKTLTDKRGKPYNFKALPLIRMQADTLVFRDTLIVTEAYWPVPLR